MKKTNPCCHSVQAHRQARQIKRGVKLLSIFSFCLMPQSFIWIEYTGYILVYTDAGGIGIAKELEQKVEIFLPDTAIKEIAYVDGDSPNLILKKKFTALKIESTMARKKKLA